MLLAQNQDVWTPSLDELKLIAPELAIIVTILAILVSPMFVGRKPGVSAFLTTAGLIVAFFLDIGVMSTVADGAVGLLEPGDAPAMLIADNFTALFKMFLFVFMVAVTGLWWIGSARGERNAPEFFMLLLGSALGMSLMVSSYNLLLIVMAIELASLPSYAIVGFDKGSRPGAEASLKYVIFGSISAAIMLYGVSLIYGLFGTLDLRVLAVAVRDAISENQNLPLLFFALFAFFGGIAFKISAVPFHFWCPDVFQGAKVEVTTWLSVASKAAGICLLLRVMHMMASVPGQSADYLEPITKVIGIFAAITCFVGNLAAYRQTSVKRLLAYSSIAHAGYMLMLGCIILVPERSGNVWETAIIYILTYLLMNLGAFGVTGLVVWRTGSDELEKFNGLGKKAPIVAASMTICLFSLIGMPPLGGFLAKWWLIVSLGEAGASWLWWLIVWASLNTLFSLFFYVKILKHMYMQEDTSNTELNAHPLGIFIVQACAVCLILTGTLFPSRIKDWAGEYSSNHYADSMYTTVTQNSDLAENSANELAATR